MILLQETQAQCLELEGIMTNTERSQWQKTTFKRGNQDIAEKISIFQPGVMAEMALLIEIYRQMIDFSY